MIYEDVLEYLRSLAALPYQSQKLDDEGSRAEVEPNLKRMRPLAEALGNPHRGLPFVHVGGTSGKGSVCKMIHSALQAAGYTVGLFSSPHVTTPLERIAVGERLIAESDFCRHAETVRAAIERLCTDHAIERPLVFEFYLALALLHFAETKPDAIVLEVGAGGTFDGTNIIESALATVITPISLDHTHFLGNTIEEIARDKAGIIKPRGTLVTSGQAPDAMRVLRERCAKQGARLVEVEPTTAVLSSDAEGSSLVWRGEEYHIGMPGTYQTENAALALTALGELSAKGFVADLAATRRGLAAARLPGRLETMSRSPRVVLDGAHNPAKAAALARALEATFPHRSLLLVCGTLLNKDTAGIVAALAPSADVVIATQPLQAHRKVTPAEEVAEVARRHCQSVEVSPVPQEALDRAIALAQPDDLVCVTGSISLVGEIRERWISQACVRESRNCWGLGA